MNRTYYTRFLRGYFFFISLILLICIVGCEDGNNVEYAEVVNVKTVLNVRQEPNAESNILDKLESSEKVEVCSDIQNDWVKIKKGNMYGYVKSSYLRVISNDEKDMLLGDKNSNDSNTIANFWNSSGSTVKTIVYVILGILCFILIACTAKYIALALGIIISTFFVTLGFGMLAGIIGLVLNVFDFDVASVWMKCGFGLGLLMSIFMTIIKPKEFATYWHSSSSSSGGGSHSVSNNKSESSDQPRERTIYDRDAYCENCFFYNSISHECYRTTTPYEVNGYERACPYYK